MKHLALLALSTMFVGCQPSGGSDSSNTGNPSPFDYDGYWSAHYAGTYSDSAGVEEDIDIAGWLTVDCIEDSDVCSFSGIPGKLTPYGLIFGSDKNYDVFLVGKAEGLFSGGADVLDPSVLQMEIQWTYPNWDPVFVQTYDYTFTLDEKIYE